MREERCETCRFWDRPAVGEHLNAGECHRYPPVVNGGFEPEVDDGETACVRTLFPVVMAAEWCGEWQPKQPVKLTTKLPTDPAPGG